MKHHHARRAGDPNEPRAPTPAAQAIQTPDTPTFEELLADPGIAPLLDFTPVPRRFQKAEG